MCPRAACCSRSHCAVLSGFGLSCLSACPGINRCSHPPYELCMAPRTVVVMLALLLGCASAAPSSTVQGAAVNNSLCQDRRTDRTDHVQTAQHVASERERAARGHNDHGGARAPLNVNNSLCQDRRTDRTDRVQTAQHSASASKPRAGTSFTEAHTRRSMPGYGACNACRQWTSGCHERRCTRQPMRCAGCSTRRSRAPCRSASSPSRRS